MGWGGPAKGFVNKPPRPFGASTPEYPTQTIPGGKGDPVKMSDRKMKRESDEIRAQGLRDLLHDIAQGGETDMVRVRAAEAWLNRHEGLPVARNISVTPDDIRSLSDAALDIELQRLSRAISDSTQRIASADVPEESDDMVP